jgi:predicted transcriptional regulator
MVGTAILLSVRPQYAEMIFDGTKTVELRRARLKQIGKGTLALIYIPAPVKCLAGAFRIEHVVESPLDELWEKVRTRAGVTREEYDAYFAGTSEGVAIFFSEVWQLIEPVELQAIREHVAGFHPPQGFRYARIEELMLPQLADFVENAEIPLQDSFLTES